MRCLLKSAKTVMESAKFDPPKDLGGQELKDSPCKEIVEMKDSCNLYEDMDAEELWKRFSSCGYLYFKKVLNQEKIIKADICIRSSLKEMGVINDEEKMITQNKGGVVDIRHGIFISGQNVDTDPECERRWLKICQSKELKTMMNDGITTVHTFPSHYS